MTQMLLLRHRSRCCLLLGAALCGASTGALSADLFQFDFVFETDLVEGVFEFSSLVEGTDDSDPDEPWESFDLDDAGPWSLASDNPLLTVTGSDLFNAYGPTFSWGGMTLDIESIIGESYSDLQVDWVMSGPEWNHDSISGDGLGQITDGSDVYDMTITSWSVTLVPAPGAVLLLGGLPTIVRRRRS